MPCAVKAKINLIHSFTRKCGQLFPKTSLIRSSVYQFATHMRNLFIDSAIWSHHGIIFVISLPRIALISSVEVLLILGKRLEYSLRRFSLIQFVYSLAEFHSYDPPGFCLVMIIWSYLTQRFFGPDALSHYSNGWSGQWAVCWNSKIEGFITENNCRLFFSDSSKLMFHTIVGKLFRFLAALNVSPPTGNASGILYMFCLKHLFFYLFHI